MKRLVAPALPAALLLCAAPAAAQGWTAAASPSAAPLEGLGRRATPNIGLSAHETTWHVRAALNVAALACRDAADVGTSEAYNQMLEAESRPLAAADAGVKAQYRARYGSGWESVHDRDMTRLYNYFAQPPAHAAFCATARDILNQTQGLSPIEFADFAAWALPRLDAPFSGAPVRDEEQAPAVEVAAAIPPPPGMIVP